MMFKFLEKKYIIIFIIFLGAFLRIINLNADIPYFVQTNYIVDEGGWIHNARNHFIKGEWISGTHDQPYYSALGYSYIIYIFFKIFGLSLVSAKYVSALSGVVTVILLWLFILSNDKLRVANLGAFFLAFAGFHIVYSRIVMTEVLLTMFLMLSLYLWSLKRNLLCGFFSGICFSAMFIIKVSAIYFVPIYLILFLAERIRKESNAKQLNGFILGNLTLFLIYFLYFVVPNWKNYLYWNVDFLESYVEGVNFKFIFEIFLFNMLPNNPLEYYNKLFASIPILFFISYLCIMNTGISLSNDWRAAIRKISYTEVVGISIVIGNAILLAISSYKPERRFIPSMLGICMLAASAVERGYLIDDNCYKKYREGIAKNYLMGTIIGVPIFVYICTIVYSLFGDWKLEFIRTDKSIAFNGQAFILFPLYLILIGIMKFLKIRGLNEKLIKLSAIILMAQSISCWMYYLFLWFGNEVSLFVRVIMAGGVSIISIFFWKGITIRKEIKAISFTIINFALMQAIIIGYTLIQPNYSYRNMGTEVQKMAENAIIITTISAPLASFKGDILYAMPNEVSDKITSREVYILNMQREGTLNYGCDLFAIFGKKENLRESSELKRSFDVTPYGSLSKFNFEFGLWKKSVSR